MLPESLDPDALRTIAIVVLAVVILLFLVVMRVVQKMVLKVIFLGLLAGIGVFVWYERADLANCKATCACSVAGIDVQVPNCPPGSG